MKKAIESFLTFSKRERLGIFVLSLICILTWIIPSILPEKELKEDDLEISFAAIEMKKDSMIRYSERQFKFKRIGNISNFSTVTPVAKSPVLFKFNPNLIGKDDWIKMGLTAKVSESIIKYVTKGGRFRRREDLKKIYGMRADDFERISPYVSLPDIDTAINFKSNKAISNRTIDINLADSIQWLALPGIGEKLASRIIRFRNKLGGFNAVSQLREVYGIDSLLFIAIQNKLTVEEGRVQKIKINEINFEDLKMHPYAGYMNAKLVIAFRIAHGPFKSASSLEGIEAIDKVKMNKLLPYVAF